MANVIQKLFLKKLVPSLYPENVFWTKGKKDDGTGKYGEILYPISNKIGGYKQGAPTQYPVTMGGHENGQGSYSLEKIWVPPIVIPEEQELKASENIQQDIVSQMRDVLQTGMADLSAYNYGPTAADRLFKTTGTKTRTNTITNGTGNVKRITKEDILKVKKRMLKDNGGSGQIFCLITPEMWEDLLLIDDLVDYDKTGVARKLERGMIGNIAGIEFMYRWNEDLGSTGLVYNGTSDAKKKNYKSDGSVNYVAGDRAAALFFIPSMVRYSHTTPDVNVDNRPAGYLGANIAEAWVHFGAAITRQTDQKGVAALIEATAS